MHLVEARKNNLKFHNINNRDLFNLFEILLNEKGCINEIKEKRPEGCRIAILCISEDVQNTIDLLAEAGIKGIVDFTHVHYNTPNGVIIRSVDVVSMIQELVFETNAENK